MSRGTQVEPPVTGSPGIDRVVQDCRLWLAERGELVVGSGSFCAGPFSGSIHCDYGPLHQDKNANQDFALAWCPAEAGDGRQLRLVLALADGLTNSYRSEWAAAVACWVAVRAVVGAAVKYAPQELAKFAFNEAGQMIARASEEFSRDPEASCPDGQFLSTWKYILKKGGLFQTTLTLAWLDERHFYFASVGDGGALCRQYGSAAVRTAADDRILAACDLETQQVHALGPAERDVGELDCWSETAIDGPFLAALFTDGIGRGIGDRPFTLLNELESLHAAGMENSARHFIERAIRERPKDFDDNLTLAVIHASQPEA